jgi:serine/threonine-protein kinase RsbW
VRLGPDDEPGFLWEGRSPPLDAVAVSGPRRQAAARLPRGGTLMLYTDGLVERREHALDVGLEHLLGETGRHAGEDVAGMLTSVVRAMNDDHSDDVCLLAAHRKAERVRHGDAPARPARRPTPSTTRSSP